MKELIAAVRATGERDKLNQLLKQAWSERNFFQVVEASRLNIGWWQPYRCAFELGYFADRLYLFPHVDGLQFGLGMGAVDDIQTPVIVPSEHMACFVVTNGKVYPRVTMGKKHIIAEYHKLARVPAFAYGVTYAEAGRIYTAFNHFTRTGQAGAKTSVPMPYSEIVQSKGV